MDALKIHIEHLEKGRRKYRKLMGIDTGAVCKLAHMMPAEQAKLLAEYDLVVSFATGRELVVSFHNAPPAAKPNIEKEMQWLEDHCDIFDPTWTIEAHELRRGVDWTYRPRLMRRQELDWEQTSIDEGNSFWVAMKTKGNAVLEKQKYGKQSVAQLEEALRRNFIQNVLNPPEGDEGFEARKIRDDLTEWGIPLEKAVAPIRNRAPGTPLPWPTAENRARMHAKRLRAAADGRRTTVNDFVDIDLIGPGEEYCDIVLTDRSMAGLARDAGFQKTMAWAEILREERKALS